MTNEISRAEQRAMKCLSDWVDALQPKFNTIEMATLKTRMVAAFREYENEIYELERGLKFTCCAVCFEKHGFKDVSSNTNSPS